MNWYFTSLLVRQRLPGLLGRYVAREHHCLLTAEDHDLAYVHALGLGERLAAARPPAASPPGPDSGVLVGLTELLLVHDTPDDGSELLWSEREVVGSQLAAATRQERQLRAFTDTGPVWSSGWYVASVVLVEVHDTGTHGDTYLMWTNSYLIEAADPHLAYERALELGKAQETAPGSHSCNGDTAHWALQGLHDLVGTVDAPGGDATLWVDQYEISPDRPEPLVPDRQDLGVFRWETARPKRG